MKYDIIPLSDRDRRMSKMKKVKKAKKTRIHNWFKGSWSPTLQGICEGEVKFKFTYSWNLDSQVKVIDLKTKRIIEMSLDTFRTNIKTNLKDSIYVEA